MHWLWDSFAYSSLIFKIHVSCRRANLPSVETVLSVTTFESRTTSCVLLRPVIDLLSSWAAGDVSFPDSSPSGPKNKPHFGHLKDSFPSFSRTPFVQRGHSILSVFREFVSLQPTSRTAECSVDWAAIPRKAEVGSRKQRLDDVLKERNGTGNGKHGISKIGNL